MNGRGNKFYELVKPFIPEGGRYHEMNCRSGYASVSVGTPERLPEETRHAIAMVLQSDRIKESKYADIYWLDVRHGLLDTRFNRKKFDPKRDYDDRIILGMLRMTGRSRFRHIVSGRRGYRDVQSVALRELSLKQIEGGTFIDLGAGDSGDCALAQALGYTSVAFDLFPRSREIDEYPWNEYVIGDIAEHISMPDGAVDVAVCQAMIDLIEPEARPGFYKEVRRVLKVGGKFSISFCRLQNGWGYNQFDESLGIEKAGFIRIMSYGAGYVFQAS